MIFFIFSEPDFDRPIPGRKKHPLLSNNTQSQIEDEQRATIPKQHRYCNINNNQKPKFESYGTDVYNFQGQNQKNGTSLRTKPSCRRTEIKKGNVESVRQIYDRVPTDQVQLRSYRDHRTHVAPGKSGVGSQTAPRPYLNR